VFGVGLPEMAVIALVAVIVFGPDRLPEFARQAGRMVRQLKEFADGARDDLRKELGPEFADFELTDLDPRRMVRKYVQDAWDEPDTDTGVPGTGPATLQKGERPPYDSDAT
jgi:sec-independent protein translocase protein TatB